MTKLIPLTTAELKELREQQWTKQNFKCAILNIRIEADECVLDHKHKLKSEECGGPDGLGCLRGVIHHNVNVFEGKLERLWKRYGLSKVITLPDLLRRCADYIEHPPMEPLYIHPNEKPKKKDLYKRLSKTEYKRICKFYFVWFPNRRVLPKFSKNIFIKDKWDAWLKKANEYNKMKANVFTKIEKELIKKAQTMIKQYDEPVKKVKEKTIKKEIKKRRRRKNV